MMNRWKILVSVLVLCFVLISVVVSEDASKHMDDQKHIKKATNTKSPRIEQSNTGRMKHPDYGYSGLESTTIVTIGTGPKEFLTNIPSTFTAFTVGNRVRVISATTPTD